MFKIQRDYHREKFPSRPIFFSIPLAIFLEIGYNIKDKENLQFS